MTSDQLSDRFNRYDALYLLCVQWHSGQWSRGYRLLSRLYSRDYRPGRSVQGGDLEPAAREYYRRWSYLTDTL